MTRRRRQRRNSGWAACHLRMQLDIVSCTSNRPQHDIGNIFCLYISCHWPRPSGLSSRPLRTAAQRREVALVRGRGRQRLAEVNAVHQRQVPDASVALRKRRPETCPQQGQGWQLLTASYSYTVWSLSQWSHACVKKFSALQC